MVLSDFLDEIDIDLNYFSVIHPGIDSDISSEYYHYDSFNNLSQTLSPNFAVIHYNIRSLYPKMDLLNAELCQLNCKFDILCFSECWLTEITRELVKFDGYGHYSSLRTGRRGGGISVFVSDDYDCRVLTNMSLCYDYIESLFIEMKCGNLFVLIGVLYRPPSGNKEMFIDKVNELLTGLRLSKYHRLLMMGDFNIDMLVIDESSNTHLINMFYSYSLLPLITRPTRITSQSATLLDNFFISRSNDCIAGSIVSDVSDHLPIFCLINNLLPRKKPTGEPIQFKYRLTNDSSITNLCNDLRCIDFSSLFQSNDVDNIMKNFSDTIYGLYNKNCKIKTKTVSYRSFVKPWIKGQVLEKIKQRQNMYLLYRSAKIGQVEYKRFCNSVTSILRKAKRSYFAQRFSMYKNDIKKTWKCINDVLGRRNMNRCNVSSLRESDAIVTDRQKIANIFNSYFSSVGKNISESVGPGLGSFRSYLAGNYVSSFMFSQVTSNDIIKIINSFKIKSTPIDSISVVVLKNIGSIIAPYLARIINLSLTQGIFPCSLKVARVVPIYKKGSREDKSNYRPISILSVFSKIVEKAVYKQVYNYLLKHSILSDRQYGFRTGKSTTHALLNYLNYLYPVLDSNQCVFSIFLDFSKAFDSVDHSILLSKLYYYGFRGVSFEWFKSYLTNRAQYVSLSGPLSSVSPGTFSSKKLIVSHGVPQGSVLGPLLFNIFINDLPNSSDKFKFTLFADDSTLSMKFDPNSDVNVANVVNSELLSVNNWLLVNKIKINITKTSYMIFSYRRNINAETILFGNGEIFRSDSVQFLGVFFDENLKFDKHVNHISSKMSRALGMFNKVRYLIPDYIMLHLYNSLIFPYLMYAVEIWGGTSACYINKVLKVQKAAVRSMRNLPYNTHTSDHFKQLCILKLPDIYKYRILLLIFSALNFGSHPDIFVDLQRNSSFHSHSTRYSNNLVIPHFRLSKTQMSISFVGSKLWNDLPEDLKSLSSLSVFKRNLKRHLMGDY